MWRKPEESKGTSPSPEVRESPQVVQPTVATPVATSQAPAVREATTPTGHLTSSLIIKGEITGREDLFIDGEVHGKVSLEGARVTIGPNGRVTADIEAREIVVRGRVQGNLRGRERVEIRQSGNASGDVITQRILVEDGAELHGRVEVTRAEERVQPKASPKNTPAATTPEPAPAVAAPVRQPATVA